MMAKLTTRAQKAWRLASEGAAKRGRQDLAPIDLLVGILAEGTGVGAGGLNSFGLDLPALRRAFPHYPHLEDSLGTKRLSPDPDAVRVLEEAANASGDVGHNYVGTEHLVLGLLATQEERLATVFRKLDIDRETVRGQILGLLGQARPRKPVPFDRTTVARLEELSALIQDRIRQLADTVDRGKPTADLRERLKELCLRVFETIDPGPESMRGDHR